MVVTMTIPKRWVGGEHKQKNSPSLQTLLKDEINYR